MKVSKETLPYPQRVGEYFDLLSSFKAALGSAANQIDRCAQDRALGKVGQGRGDGGDDDILLQRPITPG